MKARRAEGRGSLDSPPQDTRPRQPQAHQPFPFLWLPQIIYRSGCVSLFSSPESPHSCGSEQTKSSCHTCKAPSSLLLGHLDVEWHKGHQAVVLDHLHQLLVEAAEIPEEGIRGQMVNEVRKVQDLGVIIQVESCRETEISEGKLEAEEHSNIYSSFPSHPHSQTADLHLTQPSLPSPFTSQEETPKKIE